MTNHDAGSALPVVLDLLRVALIAKLAAELGAPRLALRAAREAEERAAALRIALARRVASVPAAAEDEALADVRASAELLPLLAPNPDGAGSAT